MSTTLKNLSDYNPEHIPSATSFRFAIIVSEWNEEITGALLSGALETLIKHGAGEDMIKVYYVPGSFELPSAAGMVARQLKPDAVLCLGCVIQGETRHFDFICQSVANGITNVSLEHHIPVIFGVLTTNTQEQARDRSGGKHGNKGTEAAIAAIKMAALQRDINTDSGLI